MGNKKFKLLAIILISYSIYLFSCGDKPDVPPPPDVCASKTITVTTAITNSSACSNTGSIAVNAGGSSGFNYKLNSGGTYQASNVFNNLAVGTYTVFVKDVDGCEKTKSATVASTGGSITVTTTTTNSAPCTNSGSITVTATGSTGFTYNINSGTFQASNVFNNLAAGTYTITAKDISGCQQIATATITTSGSAGPLFTQVRALVSARCGGVSCHLGGQSQSGVNFDADCSIVTHKARINQRAVIEGTMPQPGPLSQSEKDKITAWINAGGNFTD